MPSSAVNERNDYPKVEVMDYDSNSNENDGVNLKIENAP